MGWRLCENVEAIEGSSPRTPCAASACHPDDILVADQNARLSATQKIVLQFRRAPEFSHSLGGEQTLALRPEADVLSLTQSRRRSRFASPDKPTLFSVVRGWPRVDWLLRPTLIFRQVGSDWRLAYRHANPRLGSAPRLHRAEQCLPIPEPEACGRVIYQVFGVSALRG